jgi:hypothetical protein
VERISATGAIGDGTKRIRSRKTREEVFDDKRFRGCCVAGAWREGTINIVLGVAHLGERQRPGDVAEVAIGSDANSRTNSCEEIGRQRLRDRERRHAIS